MKKLLAFIVALALIASLFIVPAGAAGIVDCDSAGLVAGYLDDIRWGAWGHSYIGTAVGAGVPGGGESLHSWWNGLGADGLVRSAYTFNQGFDELIIRGWIGFDQPIVAMGYQYNDEAPVIDTYGQSFEETEDAVRTAGGQYARRFLVWIPLAPAGQYTVRVVAVLQDGTVVKLNSQSSLDANFEFRINNIDDINFKPANTVIDYADADQFGMSLDSIFWNYVNAFGSDGDSSARAKMDTFAENGVVDSTKYGGIALSYTGWVDFKQPVIGFGYMIDDQIVLAPGYSRANEDTLKGGVESIFGAGNADNVQRFFVTVPIGELTGTKTIGVVAQLADGTVVKLNSENGHERNTFFNLKFVDAPAPETSDDPGDEPGGNEGLIVDYESEAASSIGMSLDAIYWNGDPVNTPGDGNARANYDGYCEADGSLDIAKYSGESIGFAGWTVFRKAIRAYGYMIDDELVLKDEFSAGAEPGLADAVAGIFPGEDCSGVLRFHIVVPIKDIVGTKTVVAVAQLTDGTVVKLNSSAIHNRDTSAVLTGVREQVPQTGDNAFAMISVAAMLAMAAAVVFAKRRSF